MQLPAVAPLPGRDMPTVFGYLTTVRNNLSNLGSGDASVVLRAYQQWASSSAETLGFAFDHAAIESLVLTRRCWHLMATFRLFGEADNGPSIHQTIGAERTDRLRVLDELLTSYRLISTRWGQIGDKLVVPDTNFFLHHIVSFDQADWLQIAQPIEGQNVRVIVPIAVIRELDRQKISGKRTKVGKPEEELTTRARRTIRALRDMFVNPDEAHELSPWVHVELLQDALAHRPAPSVDAEIIERTLAAKALSGKDIQLMTRDLGMKLTAAAEGLAVLDQV